MTDAAEKGTTVNTGATETAGGDTAGHSFEPTFDKATNTITYLHDPRYGAGSLGTKYVADEVDINSLENTQFYASYHREEKGTNHTSSLDLRTAFNSREDSPALWFLDAYGKVSSAKTNYTLRAVLSQNPYFLAAAQWIFPHNTSLRAGLETEVGKSPRHFWKLGFRQDRFKLNAIFSGDLACCHGGSWLDTVTLVAKYNQEFKGVNHLNHAHVRLTADFSVQKKNLLRTPTLFTELKLKQGNVQAEFELGKELNSELTLFHNVHKSAALYLNYKGSLKGFSGLKTGGFQLRVADYGKVRTSYDSEHNLRNTFIFKAHEFANIVQYTQYNTKAKDASPQFGLGITLGN